MTATAVSVRIPASTANLGPGFDCLGLALDLWNHASFSIEGYGLNIEIQGEGENILPRDNDNHIFRSFYYFYEVKHLPLPGNLNICCRNHIPLSSGLGSSAASCLAGLMAANKLSGISVSTEEILRMAITIEGHPDNVAAALFGGLVIVINDQDAILTRRFEVPELHAAVVIPNIDFPTGVARSVLPGKVPLKDAVFNLGRTAMVCEAIRTGDYTLLGKVMDDRLHQPYRLPLIPGGEGALLAARQAGASAAAISGAGPGLIAFSSQNSEKAGAAMASIFEQHKVACRTLLVSSTNRGTVSDII